MRISDQQREVKRVNSLWGRRLGWWAAFAALLSLVCLFMADSPVRASEGSALPTREAGLQPALANEPPVFGSVPDSTLYISRPMQRIGSNLSDYTVGFVPVEDPDDARSSLQFSVSVVGTPDEGTDAIFGLETTRQTADGLALELMSGFVPFEFGQYGSGQYEIEISVWDGKDGAGVADTAVDATTTIYLKYEKNSQPFFEVGRNGLLLFDGDISDGVYDLRESIPVVNVDCDVLTYSLSGDDALDFSVDAATGELELVNTTVLQTTYSIVISVSDGFDYSGATDAGVDDSIEIVVTKTPGAFDPSSHHFRTGADADLLASTALGLDGLGSLIWIESEPAPGLDVSAYVGADAQQVTVYPDFLVNISESAQGAWLTEIRPAVWGLLANPNFPNSVDMSLIASDAYTCARTGSAGLVGTLRDNEAPLFGGSFPTEITHAYDPSQEEVSIGVYEVTDPEGHVVDVTLRGADSDHFDIKSIGNAQYSLVPSDYPAPATYEIIVLATDNLAQTTEVPVSIDWLSDPAGR